MNCRLIIDPPQSGDWNMAVDEALLNDAAEQGLATLRFYEWLGPTLSLGYFQEHKDRIRHSASRDLPLVRRASGGGALVHHHELTYSVALPQIHPLAGDAERLYDTVHGVLVDWLNDQLPVDLRANAALCLRSQKLPIREQPFLCFQRRSRGDLLIDLNGEPDFPFPCAFDGRFKVCGSAQRRRAGAVLQHGGLLLAASPFAPELPGLFELTGWKSTTRDMAHQLSVLFASKLQLALTAPGDLLHETAAMAERIYQSKFSSAVWTERR